MESNIFIFLVVFIVPFATAECPCEVSQGSLSCTRDTIANFPEDVIANCQDLVASNQIRAIDLQGQFIKELGPNSFQHFPKAIAISLSFNEIEKIDKDAFADLDKLSRLYLEENKITDLPDGVFDGLTNLNTLDLIGNPVATYTTK